MLILKKGRLLISEPSLNDPTFFKSVILLTHHTTDESIGLVLNHPTKINLNEILNNIPLSDFPVYIGGPVAKNSIHFIHTLGKIIPGNQKIIDVLYGGRDFEKIIKLMSDNRISKDEIRFFAGYSGWDAEQLNKEIKDNSWIVNKSNKKICMEYSSQKLWGDIIKTKKKKYAIWTNMPKDPNMN